MQGQEQIVYAFIDSQNLYQGIRRAGWKLDFDKFRNYLRTKYLVSKAFLFIGYVPGNESLYQDLQRSGYILIFKPTMKVFDGEKVTYKGNVDAEMVLRVMIEFPKYSNAIIVSGDGDFYCLIEYLAEANKLSKIIAPNKDHSALLKKYSDHIVILDPLKHKLSR